METIISAEDEVVAIAARVTNNPATQLAYRNLSNAVDTIRYHQRRVETAAISVRTAAFCDLVVALLHLHATETSPDTHRRGVQVVVCSAQRPRDIEEVVTVIAEASRTYPSCAKGLTKLLDEVTVSDNLLDCFAVNELSDEAYRYVVNEEGRLHHFRHFLPRYVPQLTLDQTNFVEVLLEDWNGSLFEAISTARLLRPERTPRS
jgi:hypothetical protein